MKKNYLWIFSLILVMGMMTACQSEETSSSDSTTVQESETTTTVEDASEENSSVLEDSFRLVFADKYISVPPYPSISKSVNDVFVVKYSRFICLTNYDYDVSEVELDEIQELLFDDFAYASGYYTTYSEPVEFRNETTETITVNGMEAWRFEGTLYCDYEGYTAEEYCVGYTCIVNDTPLMITGVVVDEDQPQDLIDEITTYVDEMITTIRDEE